MAISYTDYVLGNRTIFFNNMKIKFRIKSSISMNYISEVIWLIEFILQVKKSQQICICDHPFLFDQISNSTEEILGIPIPYILLVLIRTVRWRLGL